MNQLFLQLEHDYFKYNRTNFTTVIDNVKISFAFVKLTLEVNIYSEKSLEENGSLAEDLMMMLFIYLGAFPRILNITYNGEYVDTTGMARKFCTDNYFVRCTMCICPITENSINQATIDAYRNIPQMPIFSMQCLISEAYKHIVTNHRITLLLHVIDGLVSQIDTAGYGNRMKVDYNLNYNPRDNDYAVKVYYLCLNYFFDYDRRYSCDVLSTLNVNECNFIRIVTQTRVWYSHFSEESEKPLRLKDGSDIWKFFEIVFYSLRLHILNKLGVPSEESNIKEYYNIIHDWCVETKGLTNVPYKSRVYKINAGIKEMTEELKRLTEIKE